jgi:hypothetical protein
LREFCGGGNSEPNDTLKKVECGETITSRLTTVEPAIPGMPYLLPKETRKMKRTPSTTAKAQQAGEHDG